MEPSPPSRTLACLLSTAVRTIWPRRTQHELALDLAQRKAWNDADFEDACHECADWLVSEVGLASVVVAAPMVGDWAALRSAAREMAGDKTVESFAERAGHLFGRSASNVRNNLSTYHPGRVEHWWIAAMGRIACEQSSPAVLYHQRSRQSVNAGLERLAGACDVGVPDAADVLLLTSLLALYQRRRPTNEVRGSRGQVLSRREAPKPIVLLLSSLFPAGVARKLLALAPRIEGGDPRRHLAALGVEWALTVAHAAPHRAVRAGARRKPDADVIECVVRSASEILPDQATALRFRLDLMLAYAGSAPMSVTSSVDAYGEIHGCFAAVRADVEALPAAERAMRLVEADAPGSLMLAPQVRRMVARVGTGDQ